ncbi:hypothetical protein ES689_13550 [Frigoribacterium sp. ACAM 257]|uniref:hypothetical protein n=1 Tax=Frigoribacterium sp. ACAM 257 TaxID=2508998 RepID=UPI0011B9AF68|nr:hypothetical protein [Frigoribacterium sp. ACAM 257]TWX35598.1 hypothetical protein ES689_13550 [Frigoribacterium sp. ACAM 257]
MLSGLIGAVALLGSLAIAPAPAVASAPEGGISAEVDAAPTSTTFSLACTNGNFRGEAQVTASLEYSGGQANWTTTVDRYRITRSNGQSRGDKANIDLEFVVKAGVLSNLKTASANSSDAMRQDGSWHDLGLGKTMSNAPLQHPYPSEPLSAMVDVRFTFDKSNGDPSCRSWKIGDWGRAVKDVRTSPGAFGRDDEISSCTVQTSGATCSIAKTDTKASTVSVTSGLDSGWVSGQLSASWTTSRAVSVSCTSPQLTAGQRWAAYPSGTYYTFSTFARLFDVQALVAPGHAFEVDGGVGCEATGTPYCGTSHAVPLIRSAEHTAQGIRITGCGEPGAQIKTTNDPGVGWYTIESGAAYVGLDGSFDVTTKRRVDQQAVVKSMGTIAAESNRVTPQARLTAATLAPSGGVQITGWAEPGSEIRSTNDPHAGWYSIEGGRVHAQSDGSFRLTTGRLVDGWAVIQSFGRHQSVSNKVIPTN